MGIRRPQSKRGVVLLIVLSLLTLMLIAGITFAIVAGTHKRAAQQLAKVELFGDPPSDLLDRAFYQMLRDTNNVQSVARTHSLLRDMYGTSAAPADTGQVTVTGLIRNVPTQSSPQFLTFQVSFFNNMNIRATTPDYFAGLVFTFTSGSYQNVSVRILGSSFDANTNLTTLVVMLPSRDISIAVAPVVNDTFLINGRAFAGTGAGYNESNGKLDRTAQNANVPLALIPGRRADSVLGSASAARYVLGGLNEDYDAVDYQNMFMAGVFPNGNSVSVVPTFHRPALANYWEQNLPALNPTPTNPAPLLDFRRGYIMRPMPWDHPNFTGSNRLNPTGGICNPGTDGRWGVANVDDDGNGQVDDPAEAMFPGSDDRIETDPNRWNRWDVDNDGDGVPDSLWVDLGFPVQTDKSGRLYKPLFAIHCVDMDGKLNLNTGGTLAELTRLGANTGLQTPAPVILAGGNAGAGFNSATAIVTGQGVGTAEISLRPLFASVADYRALLRGNTANNVPGRYGFNLQPGLPQFDGLTAWNFLDHAFPGSGSSPPSNYFVLNSTASAYFSPPDPHGELVYGLDFRGMPLYERPRFNNQPTTHPLVNNPYELRLGADRARGWFNDTPVDLPFSAAELERILRANDHDASLLPDRLWRVVSTFHAPANRRRVTTDSYDVPVPNMQVPDNLANATQVQGQTAGVRPKTLGEYFYMRLLANGVPPAQANLQVRGLLPPDLRLGYKFNLNQLFGNARDDNNNGVVDELIESAVNQPIVDAMGYYPTWPADPDRDGVTNNDPDSFLARQQYAKYLYCLIMMLKDPAARVDYNGDGMANNTETAYAIAQWCINVVDFRDPDSIMTPFEFDINPFGAATNQTNFAAYGWDVDGIPSTLDDPNNQQQSLPDRGLVWGTERPELLITEAVAFHDRRTEDLQTDGRVNPGNGNGNGNGNGDEDYDQRLRPRGSTFLELYNPWAGDDRLAPELYNAKGVDLTRRAAGNASGAPVWRMIVVEDPDVATGDPPRDPDAGPLNPSPLAAERIVYFVNPNPNNPSPANVFYSSLPVAPIGPGRYAVVGSPGQSVDDQGNALDLDGDGITDYVTTVGRLATAQEGVDLLYDQTRRIVLEPNLNPEIAGVNNHANRPETGMFDNQPVANANPQKTDVQPAVGIVINQPVGLSVTEPIGGYPQMGANGATWDATLADHEGAYTVPIDRPLDANSGELMQDGTYRGYKVVHLQRLANPLIPFHPLNNPYRTIDSMSLDMTSFNGVTDDANDPDNQGNGTIRFLARQRGDSDNGAQQVRQLWAHERIQPAGGATPDEALVRHYFPKPLTNSFGYLNDSYRPYYGSRTAGPGGPTPAPTISIPPLTAATYATPADFYVGAPDATSVQPFAYLAWNNRSFHSAMELALVPRTSSFRLPIDFSVTDGNSQDPYSTARGVYGHLLNLRQDPAQANQGEFTAPFHRALEYLHVPSRWTDSEMILRPDAANGPLLGAPFNRIPNFREPGKVNLNTVFDASIWNGVLARRQTPSYNDIANSRRGYAGPVVNPAYPTLFANPFRGANRGERAPLASLEVPDLAAGIMRPQNFTVGGNGNSESLFEKDSNFPLNNTDRNASFRYQDQSRIANLVSTKSSVFAIWITVGYFEVEEFNPATNPALSISQNPDGYRLGQELGFDSGQVTRHRAFYMIDRSIPVAFQPGQNHNVDRCVLIRRFIE